MAAQPYDRMVNSAFIKLCAIELCLQMGMQTATPVVSSAAIALGASVTVAGILAGLSSAVSVSLRFVSGRIVSMLPPKRMLVISSVILMVSTLAFALFSSVPMMAITRVFYGMGIVVKTVIVVSLCVRVVPKGTIGQASAWLGMASVLAVAAGPNLTQFVGLNMGYSASFLLSAGLFAVAVLLGATFPNVPLGGEEASGDSKTDAGATSADAVQAPAPAPAKGLARFWDFIYRDALPLALMALLEGMIFGIVNTMTLAVGLLRGLPQMSLFFVVYGIVSFAARSVVGRVYDRLGFARVCPVMCLTMGLSMVSFALTDSLPIVVLDGVLFALGQGCLWPCLQAESVRIAPLEKSSLSTNTLMFGFDLGIMIGPMIGGAVLDIAGPVWMYVFAAGVGVLLTLWSLHYGRIAKRRSVSTPREN